MQGQSFISQKAGEQHFNCLRNSLTELFPPETRQSYFLENLQWNQESRRIYKECWVRNPTEIQKTLYLHKMSVVSPMTKHVLTVDFSFSGLSLLSIDYMKKLKFSLLCCILRCFSFQDFCLPFLYPSLVLFRTLKIIIL